MCCFFQPVSGSMWGMWWFWVFLSALFSIHSAEAPSIVSCCQHFCWWAADLFAAKWIQKQLESSWKWGKKYLSFSRCVVKIVPDIRSRKKSGKVCKYQQIVCTCLYYPGPMSSCHQSICRCNYDISSRFSCHARLAKHVNRPPFHCPQAYHLALTHFKDTTTCLHCMWMGEILSLGGRFQGSTVITSVGRNITCTKQKTSKTRQEFAGVTVWIWCGVGGFFGRSFLYIISQIWRWLKQLKAEDPKNTTVDKRMNDVNFTLKKTVELAVEYANRVLMPETFCPAWSSRGLYRFDTASGRNPAPRGMLELEYCHPKDGSVGKASQNGLEFGVEFEIKSPIYSPYHLGFANYCPSTI